MHDWRLCVGDVHASINKYAMPVQSGWPVGMLLRKQGHGLGGSIRRHRCLTARFLSLRSIHVDETVQPIGGHVHDICSVFVVRRQAKVVTWCLMFFAFITVGLLFCRWQLPIQWGAQG